MLIRELNLYPGFKQTLCLWCLFKWLMCLCCLIQKIIIDIIDLCKVVKWYLIYFWQSERPCVHDVKVFILNLGSRTSFWVFLIRQHNKFLLVKVSIRSIVIKRNHKKDGKKIFKWALGKAKKNCLTSVLTQFRCKSFHFFFIFYFAFIFIVLCSRAESFLSTALLGLQSSAVYYQLTF